MQVALENNIVFVVIEYLAILCWGLSGGLAAIRKGYDIFTIMLCGWLTALGGGLARVDRLWRTFAGKEERSQSFDAAAAALMAAG